MPNKNIVLLSNSIKLGGRCLAGVEVQKQGGSSTWIVDRDLVRSQPTWIRPISTTTDGEVSSQVAGRFAHLDIVQLTGVTPSPNGYQSENCLYTAIDKIDTLAPTEANLAQMVENLVGPLFGNRGKAVHPDHINDIKRSLIFVKSDTFTSFLHNDNLHSNQKRAKFTLTNVEYDLPITDPSFMCGTERGKTTYLTLSLGVLHQGWYSKLIAGVFCI